MLHTPRKSIKGSVCLNFCQKVCSKLSGHHWWRSGLKFELANVDLPQRPESVTKLGEWSVKCWLATDDDPTYHFGRIFPVDPQMTDNDITNKLTILDNHPSTVVGVFRLPSYQRGGETMTNMAVCLKFWGPLPQKGGSGQHCLPGKTPHTSCLALHPLPYVWSWECLLQWQRPLQKM